MALRRYQHRFLQPLEIDQANIRTNIDATRASVQSLNSASSNETSTVLKQVSETAVNRFDSVLNSFAGTFTIDVSQGTVFLGDLDFSVTNWNFTNVPTANNRATTITAIIKGNTTETYGTGATVNGVSVAGGVRWRDGMSPSSTNNYDVLEFKIVRDTGGTVYVFGDYQINYGSVSKPSFHVGKSSSGNTLTTTPTKITFDAAVYDVGGNYSDANDAFTAPIKGKYFFYTTINVLNFANAAYIQIRKNGSVYGQIGFTATNFPRMDFNPVGVIDLAVGDVVEVYGFVNTGTVNVDNAGYFGGYLI